MINGWHKELWRLAYLLTVTLLLGWLAGSIGWGLFIGLAIYTAIMLRQLYRLYCWLSAGGQNEPPEGIGLWGEVFDLIYKQQQNQLRARDRLKGIIDRIQQSSAALQDAVVMIDSHGNLEWWNQAAEQLMGLRAPSDRGQHVTNLLRDPRFVEYFERQQYQEPLTLASPVNDNLILQYQITLYGQNDRLMLARDITRLYNLEQMRKDFVANVSHELRTPLTVVTGYLETFSDSSDQLPSRWQRALKQMHQQAQRMQNLVSDLLLLSRLETTEVETEQQPVAMTALLESIRQDAIAFSGERGHQIELAVEPALQVYGSEKELRSAFSNLVFNAIKYTPAQTRIWIRWQGNASGARLCVIDEGDGIDPIHLPRLSERFYRVDKGRSAESGGTGLGLAIVKHVMLRHDGMLDIQSTLGEGSNFCCSFPARRCHWQTDSTTSQAS